MHGCVWQYPGSCLLAWGSTLLYSVVAPSEDAASTHARVHPAWLATPPPELPLLLLHMGWHHRLMQFVTPAGLLSTEAGTIGRFTGNALLSVTGRLAGVGDKQHLTVFAEALHSILAAGSVAVLAYVAVIYGRLRG